MAEYGAWSCSCQFLLGEWVAAKCVFSSDFALRCLPAKMALLRVDSPPTEFPIKQDVERCLEEYAKFCSRRDLLAIVTQSLKTSHGSFTGLSMDDIKQLQDVYNRDKDVRATLLGTFRRTAEQMQQGAPSPCSTTSPPLRRTSTCCGRRRWGTSSTWFLRPRLAPVTWTGLAFARPLSELLRLELLW